MQRRKTWKVSRIYALIISAFMMLGVFSPYLALDGAAAPEEDFPSQPASFQDGAGTSSLEFDLVRCPVDFDPNDPFGSCTAFGIDGVSVSLTGLDPDSGIDLTQSTVAPGGDGGPGRTTFVDLPAGDYSLQAQLPPEEGVRYSLYCGVAGGGVALPPVPDDSLTSTISAPDATDVACDLYVIPLEQPAEESTLDLFAFTCNASSLPDDAAPQYEDYRDACDTPAQGVDFHLQQDGGDTSQTTDANGRTQFSYPTGTEVAFFAGVPLEATEVLFCSVSQGPADEITIDETGVSRFANSEAEDRTCSWFLVEDDVPTEEPSTEVPATELPPTEVPPTEIPATEAPVVQPTESGEGLPGDDLAQISVMAMACPEDFDPEVSGVAYETLSASCDTGVEDVSFTLGYPGGGTDIRVANGIEPMVYANLEPGAYTLYSNVPLEAADEHVFCTLNGGDLYEKPFSDRGVATFNDLETEQVSCEWYIVPINQRGEETGGSLEIHLVACEAGFTGNNIFDSCHSNGLAGYDFTLSGPDGEQTGATVVTQQSGPGIVSFTSLPPGDYTFNGGPPGDFGAVELYCSNQPSNGEPTYSLDGFIASLSLAETQHVLCDWYYIPDESPGQTPTPTPEPARAEILVTLYACPAGGSGAYGGLNLGQYQEQCTEKANDVPFRLGDPSSAPLSAKTGSSGDGAVRFYDLLPGDLTMAPSLPATLNSAAVFCTIDGGASYQKALANGGTTFVNVDGESIGCSWFAVKQPETPPNVPSGSITIREYLCEKDRSQITDWDAECTPGSTGSSFTVTSTSSNATDTGTPGGNGVYVFTGLQNGFYTLVQNDGVWCRAVADRVDSQSRVIVEGGGNTDVVLYQCNAVSGLPVTGSGPAGTISSDFEGMSRLQMVSVSLMVIAIPLALMAIMETRRVRTSPNHAPVEAMPVAAPTIGDDGRTHMRFR